MALPLSEEKLEESTYQQDVVADDSIEMNDDIQEEQQIETVTFVDEIIEEPIIELPVATKFEFEPEPEPVEMTFTVTLKISGTGPIAISLKEG